MELTETGRVVYDRTYSRPKPDGTKETWPETVERVVSGNLALVPEKYHLKGEREALIKLITEFKLIPGGRHLWASGVKGRQYLFNCHVSGWGEKLSDHFEFTFMRLMEGGGVGANYSNKYLWEYGPTANNHLKVHIVCDEGHPDYLKLEAAGVLSHEYTSEWEGAFDVEDSREGWAASLVDLVDTYERPVKNTNRVYDVSRVREEGARLKTFGGRASGPIALAKMLLEVSDIFNTAHARFSDGHVHNYISGMDAMKIDHAIAKCVVSGGVRRSARMSMMHWNDPQIFEFLKCKANGDHWTTNISVVVDDQFFEQLKKIEDYTAKGYTVDMKPWLVLHAMAEGMLHNGEPGFWNYSLSQVGEPNEVICTNPCGEITLESWENCNLGHVNLAAFDSLLGQEVKDAHKYMTRFLIRATYGDVTDPKQAEVLLRNRRIGVGHLGVASAVAMRGWKYSQLPSQDTWNILLEYMSGVVDQAAREYCHELRIPIPVKMRTIAPTGSIAKMPGVSEGIHPIFAKYYDRRIRFSTIDPEQWETCMDYASRGFHVEPSLVEENVMIVTIPTKDILMDQVTERGRDADKVVETPEDLTLDQMLAFQEMYQRYWADNAVSFTANIDPDLYTVEEIMEIIKKWGPKLKGMTVFPEKSIPQSPYTRITKLDYELSAAKATDSSVDDECQTGACPVR